MILLGVLFGDVFVGFLFLVEVYSSVGREKERVGLTELVEEKEKKKKKKKKERHQQETKTRDGAV